MPSLLTTSTARASTQYALMVLAAGLLCGAIRVPFIEPLVGDRHAQLLEMPIMLLAMWRSAHYIVGSLHGADADGEGNGSEKNGGKPNGKKLSRVQLVALGLVGLAQVLAAEAAVYFLIMHREEGKTLRDWVYERDVVAGPVFFTMLGVYAALPALIAEGRI